jgi:hypothetical protein
LIAIIGTRTNIFRIGLLALRTGQINNIVFLIPGVFFASLWLYLDAKQRKKGDP